MMSICQAVDNHTGGCVGGVNAALWMEGTYTPVPGSYIKMAEYGCLEVYPPGPGSSSAHTTVSGEAAVGDRLWQSHTMAAAGCSFTSKNCAFVQIEQSGNVQVLKGTAKAPGASLWATGTSVLPRNAKNILHIVVDDLRPAMKVAYRQDYMITPAFDKLAKEGLVFDNAYCNIAVCAPSRSSFMSGIRPDVTGIFNFKNHIREPGMPKIVTMPQQFRQLGYTTLGGGKTFHYSLPPMFDEGVSWSAEVQLYFPFVEFLGSVDMAHCPINASGPVPNNVGAGLKDPALPPGWKKGANYCVVEDESKLYDYKLRNQTLNMLAVAKEIGKPWYVMAGFRRPHRDFEVHKKYWDLYPPASEFKVAVHKTRGASQPQIAFHNAGFTLPNGSSYSNNANLTVPYPDEIAQIFRKAYAVAVTQTDAYVGAVLDELDELGMAENTIVLVHSDHGWQLGEHGLWDKQTEFELATRVPLLIKVPGKPNSVGRHTSAFFELVDLHPTLAALAGIQRTLPIATNAVPTAVASQAFGQDMSAVFDDPTLTEGVPGKNASFSQWPVCTDDKDTMCMGCTGPGSSRTTIKAMGFSIRVHGWRYTAWMPFNRTLFVGNFVDAAPIATELYDHRNCDSVFDFDDDGEAINLAGDPQYASVESGLFAQLQKQYTWDPAWLLKNRHSWHVKELANDQAGGYFPYGVPATAPPPPAALLDHQYA